MKLYITDTSPYARIARIVVFEKGLEAQVEMIPAQTRTPGSSYYAINPSGRVPYLGIVLYMVTPFFMTIGIIMIPLGMWRQYRRLKRGEVIPERAWPSDSR